MTAETDDSSENKSGSDSSHSDHVELNVVTSVGSLSSLKHSVAHQTFDIILDADIVTIEPSLSPQTTVSSPSNSSYTSSSDGEIEASEVPFLYGDITPLPLNASRQLIHRRSVLAQTVLFAGIEHHELFLFSDAFVLTKPMKGGQLKVADWILMQNLKMERPLYGSDNFNRENILELYAADPEEERTIYIGFADDDPQGREDLVSLLTTTIATALSSLNIPFTQDDLYKPLKGSPFSAIIMDDLDMLTEHLCAGVDPNSMDINRQPLLSYALQFDNMEAAKELLRHHASPDIALVSSRPLASDLASNMKLLSEKNEDSENSEHSFRKLEHIAPSLPSPLPSISLLPFPSLRRASISVQKYSVAQPPKSSELKTRPLHAACSVLNVSAVKWLVWSGASVNCRDEYMLTPIERVFRAIVPEFKSQLLSVTKETVNSRYSATHYTEQELAKSELTNDNDRVNDATQVSENTSNSPCLTLPFRIGPYEHEWPVFHYEYAFSPASSPSPSPLSSPSSSSSLSSPSSSSSACSASSLSSPSSSSPLTTKDLPSLVISPSTPIKLPQISPYNPSNYVKMQKKCKNTSETRNSEANMDASEVYTSPVAQKRNEIFGKMDKIGKTRLNDISELDFAERMDRACEIMYFLCTFHAKTTQQDVNLANVDSCDQNERSMLLHAVEKGYIPLVKTLLSASASVSQCPHTSQSPLHIASKNNALEIATILLNYGACPNARDRHGNTPLHFTTSLEMISLLIQNGARPQLTNAYNVAAIAKHLSGAQADFIQDFIRSDRELREYSGIVRSDFLRESWLENEKSPVCLFCCVSFTLWTRRHHCRRCGLLVCGDCSLKKALMDSKEERVCDPCYNHLRYKENEATLWLKRLTQAPAITSATRQHK